MIQMLVNWTLFLKWNLSDVVDNGDDNNTKLTH